MKSTHGRHSGLTASVPGWNPCQGHSVVFLGKVLQDVKKMNYTGYSSGKLKLSCASQEAFLNGLTLSAE